MHSDRSSVTVDMPPGRDSPSKIVAIAGAIVSGTWRTAAIRLDASGTLDASFGSGGVAIHAAFGQPIPEDLAVQQDGGVVAGGGAYLGGLGYFALLRYASDGSSDTSFGSAGKVYILPGEINSGVEAVVVQSDGKIVAVGDDISPDNTTSSATLFRVDSNGALDASFGGSGIVAARVENSQDAAKVVAIQSAWRVTTRTAPWPRRSIATE